jgi:hypothetical protein
MSFTENRFGVLLGEEETEIDKLGNVKPVEKKDDGQPPTRREQRRGAQRQPAGKVFRNAFFLILLLFCLYNNIFTSFSALKT